MGYEDIDNQKQVPIEHFEQNQTFLTDVAKRIYADMFEHIKNKKRGTITEIREFVGNYYRAYEIDVKEKLKNETIHNGRDEISLKNVIENSDDSGMNYTLEIFVARYSQALNVKNMSEEGALQEVLDAGKKFTRSFNKAIKNDLGVDPRQDKDKQIDKEDLEEFLQDTVEHTDEDISVLDMENIKDAAKNKADSEINIDKIATKSAGIHIEQENLRVSEDVLADEYESIARDYKRNMMDKVVEEFVEEIVTEEMLREFKSPDGLLEKISFRLSRYKNKILQWANRHSDTMDHFEKSATGFAGASVFPIFAIFCAVTIGGAFGVPVTPSLLAELSQKAGPL